MTTFRELLDMEITYGVRLEIAGYPLIVRAEYVELVPDLAHHVENVSQLFHKCGFTMDRRSVAAKYHSAGQGIWPTFNYHDYLAAKRLLLALAYGYENNGKHLKMRDGELVLPVENPIDRIRALKRKVTA